ncbi:hypothetical protein AK830_g8686 [Neonectria ditissima]|uniref:Choloylglycine hydrolase/NAAA C-terminal domain-containing protein n=1 Tax=Neonectria ditissima TaxID=78410 RepID=A0A0P7B7H5_9HYPO|nr:hypothetical protein AK830_g8686 [Neonectria ditissima]
MHSSSSSSLLLLLIAASLIASAAACSRVVTTDDDTGRTTVGRSLDFAAPNTTIWAFPAGLRRFGGVSGNPFTWTSRFGSVSAVVLQKLYSEGLNSEGLAASALYGRASGYGPRDQARPALFVGLWLQYFLDSFASVADAEAEYCAGDDREEFQVRSRSVLEGVPTSVRLALSDPTGDNLVLEFVHGKLVCHHSPNHTVVTDEPSFARQIALEKRWAHISNTSLPGTCQPSDRFVRLSHYNREIPPAEDSETAISNTAGMIRAVSTPMTQDDAAAGVWPTMWRMFTDTLDKVVFYESATSPATFWYDVGKLNLTKGAEVTTLDLDNVPWRERIGDMTDHFEPVPENECIWTVC